MLLRRVIALFLALLGPFQCGLALTMLNTMLKPLSTDLGFDANVGGAFATAALFAGAAIGGLVGGPFHKYCEKYAQLFIGALFATGSLLCAFATEREICWGGPLDGCASDLLMAGRIVTGIASGLSRVVAIKYLANIAPRFFRGAIINFAHVVIAAGVFAGTMVGLPYEIDSNLDFGYEWWRVMFVLAAVPGLIQILFAGFTFRLYRAPSREEQEGLLTEEADEPSGTDNPSRSGLLSRFRGISLAPYRRAVVLGIGLPVAAQLVGVGFMTSYSTTILEDAGAEHAVLGSFIFGAGSVVASFIPVVFSNLGPTTMAYIGFAGVGVSYLALSLSEHVSDAHSGPLSTVFLLTFILSYGGGCDNVSTAQAPAGVPPGVGDLVVALGQSLSVLVSFLLVLIFPDVLDRLGAFWTFLTLALISFASLIFLKLALGKAPDPEQDPAAHA